MATTPVYGLPYPVGTDMVIDGDDAMEALAGAVEVAIRPIWAKADLTGPSSPNGSSVPLTLAYVAGFNISAAGSTLVSSGATPRLCAVVASATFRDPGTSRLEVTLEIRLNGVKTQEAKFQVEGAAASIVRMATNVSDLLVIAPGDAVSVAVTTADAHPFIDGYLQIYSVGAP